MWGGGGEIWVALTTKDAEVGVRGVGTIKREERRVVRQGFSGVAVDEMCGGVESLDPEGSRKASLKQQRLHNIVEGTKNALGFTVLGGGVRARHP